MSITLLGLVCISMFVVLQGVNLVQKQWDADSTYLTKYVLSKYTVLVDNDSTFCWWGCRHTVPEFLLPSYSHLQSGSVLWRQSEASWRSIKILRYIINVSVPINEPDHIKFVKKGLGKNLTKWERCPYDLQISGSFAAAYYLLSTASNIFKI